MAVDDHADSRDDWQRSAEDLDAAADAPDDEALRHMLSAVHQDMAQQDRGLRGKLRSRPTWQRRGLVCVALASPFLLVVLRGLRPNWREVGLSYLLTSALGLGAGALWLSLLATQPLQKPALTGRRESLWWFAAALGATSLVAWLGAAGVGAAGVGAAGVGAADGLLMHSAGTCASTGLAVALPTLAMSYFVDRGGVAGLLLAAGAAALVANALLLLRCANSDLTHCFTGHVSVGLGTLALALALALVASPRGAR